MQGLLTAAHDTAAASASQVRAIEAQERVMREQAGTMASSLELTRKVADAAGATAEAVQTVNRLSLDIFNIRNRPIISVTLNVDTDLLWKDEYVEFFVSATLKNHGISPAQIMHIDLEEVAGSPSHPINLNNALDAILDRYESFTEVLTLRWETVYIDEPWTFKNSVMINRKDILSDEFIQISILGCIWCSSLPQSHT